MKTKGKTSKKQDKDGATSAPVKPVSGVLLEPEHNLQKSEGCGKAASSASSSKGHKKIENRNESTKGQRSNESDKDINRGKQKSSEPPTEVLMARELFTAASETIKMAKHIRKLESKIHKLEKKIQYDSESSSEEDTTVVTAAGNGGNSSCSSAESTGEDDYKKRKKKKKDKNQRSKGNKKKKVNDSSATENPSLRPEYGNRMVGPNIPTDSTTTQPAGGPNATVTSSAAKQMDVQDTSCNQQPDHVTPSPTAIPSDQSPSQGTPTKTMSSLQYLCQYCGYSVPEERRHELGTHIIDCATRYQASNPCPPAQNTVGMDQGPALAQKGYCLYEPRNVSCGPPLMGVPSSMALPNKDVCQDNAVSGANVGSFTSHPGTPISRPAAMSEYMVTPPHYYQPPPHPQYYQHQPPYNPYQPPPSNYYHHHHPPPISYPPSTATMATAMSESVRGGMNTTDDTDSLPCQQQGQPTVQYSSTSRVEGDQGTSCASTGAMNRHKGKKYQQPPTTGNQGNASHTLKSSSTSNFNKTGRQYHPMKSPALLEAVSTTDFTPTGETGSDIVQPAPTAGQQLPKKDEMLGNKLTISAHHISSGLEYTCPDCGLVLAKATRMNHFKMCRKVPLCLYCSRQFKSVDELLEHKPECKEKNWKDHPVRKLQHDIDVPDLDILKPVAKGTQKGKQDGKMVLRVADVAKNKAKGSGARNDGSVKSSRNGDEEDPPKPPRNVFFVCLKCDQQFAAAQELRAHQRVPEKCEEWNRLKNRRSGLKTSTRFCYSCKKMFPNQTDFARHRRTCVNLKPDSKTYSCFSCYKTFDSQADLSTHKQLNHRSSESESNCWVCGATFRTFKEFLKHAETHKDVRSTIGARNRPGYIRDNHHLVLKRDSVPATLEEVTDVPEDVMHMLSQFESYLPSSQPQAEASEDGNDDSKPGPSFVAEVSKTDEDMVRYNIAVDTRGAVQVDASKGLKRRSNASHSSTGDGTRKKNLKDQDSEGEKQLSSEAGARKAKARGNIVRNQPSVSKSINDQVKSVVIDQTDKFRVKAGGNVKAIHGKTSEQQQHMVQNINSLLGSLKTGSEAPDQLGQMLKQHGINRPVQITTNDPSVQKLLSSLQPMEQVVLDGKKVGYVLKGNVKGLPRNVQVKSSKFGDVQVCKTGGKVKEAISDDKVMQVCKEIVEKSSKKDSSQARKVVDKTDMPTKGQRSKNDAQKSQSEQLNLGDKDEDMDTSGLEPGSCDVVSGSETSSPDHQVNKQNDPEKCTSKKATSHTKGKKRKTSAEKEISTGRAKSGEENVLMDADSLKGNIALYCTDENTVKCTSCKEQLKSIQDVAAHSCINESAASKGLNDPGPQPMALKGPNNPGPLSAVPKGPNDPRPQDSSKKTVSGDGIAAVHHEAAIRSHHRYGKLGKLGKVQMIQSEGVSPDGETQEVDIEGEDNDSI